eukprot:scaffold1678_cov287-Alexandrium_tamarense.AAC.5
MVRRLFLGWLSWSSCLLWPVRGLLLCRVRWLLVGDGLKLRQLKFKEVEVEPIFQLQRRHAFDKAVVRRDMYRCCTSSLVR